MLKRFSQMPIWRPERTWDRCCEWSETQAAFEAGRRQLPPSSPPHRAPLEACDGSSCLICAPDVPYLRQITGWIGTKSCRSAASNGVASTLCHPGRNGDKKGRCGGAGPEVVGAWFPPPGSSGSGWVLQVPLIRPRDFSPAAYLAL